MSRVITRCVWFTLTWQHCARSVLSGLHHPLLITQGLFSVCVKAVQQLLKALSKIQVQFQYSQVAVADLLLLPALVRASERTDLFLHSGRNFTDSVSEDQRALWDSHKGQYWHIKDFHSQLSTRRSFYKQVSVNRLVSVSWKVAPTFTDAKSRGLQNFLTWIRKTKWERVQSNERLMHNRELFLSWILQLSFLLLKMAPAHHLHDNQQI